MVLLHRSHLHPTVSYHYRLTATTTSNNLKPAATLPISSLPRPHQDALLRISYANLSLLCLLKLNSYERVCYFETVFYTPLTPNITHHSYIQLSVFLRTATNTNKTHYTQTFLVHSHVPLHRTFWPQLLC